MLRQRLAEEWRGCFYTAEPDPDSESDSYDPTRECFNVDGEVATTDDTQDAVADGRAPVTRDDPRTPGNDGQVDPPAQDDKAAQLAQLRELKAKLDEDRERLAQLERALERDQPHPHDGRARGRAREVYQQIVGDEEPEPPVSRFPRASQNVVAATMLLRNMPEPSNSQARRIRDEVQTLLQVAAAQQAESLASRRRGAATEKRVEPARNEREVLVHQGPPPRGRKTAPVQEHPVDNQWRHDARHDINEYRHRRHGDAEERGYSAYHGGRYDSDEDRMAPEPPGPRVFSRVIRSTPLPSPFRPRPTLPNTTVKPSQSCGWQTSGEHVSWEALEETIELSSASYHSSSPTPLADGSRSSPPTRFTTGPIWFGYSRATSKRPTYDPPTRGTSANASRNQEKLSESTLDASRSSALSSRTSPTMTSFWRLSQATRVRTWYGNWVETGLRPSTN